MSDDLINRSAGEIQTGWGFKFDIVNAMFFTLLGVPSLMYLLASLFPSILRSPPSPGGRLIMGTSSATTLVICFLLSMRPRYEQDRPLQDLVDEYSFPDPDFSEHRRQIESFEHRLEHPEDDPQFKADPWPYHPDEVMACIRHKARLAGRDMAVRELKEQMEETND